jgi:hypothetical protein
MANKVSRTTSGYECASLCLRKVSEISDKYVGGQQTSSTVRGRSTRRGTKGALSPMASLNVSQIVQMKNDMAKRVDKAKMQDMKYHDMPDIVVKVICRYRAELFFKISRKTKLSRLFNAWTDRMEGTAGRKVDGKPTAGAHLNGSAKSDAASTHTWNSTSNSSMQFIFSHNGRTLDADQTPEDQGMEDGDEILAVELMDLTEGSGFDAWVSQNG